MQVVGTAGEGVDLLVRELVEAGFVAAGKVREYRAGQHYGLVVENLDYAGHVFLFEAETVHARVYFDVHGIAGQAQLFALGNDGFQQFEAVNLGFEGSS